MSYENVIDHPVVAPALANVLPLAGISPDAEPTETASPLTISLQDFVEEFGDELLDSLNRSNPPVYTGQARTNRQQILSRLKRTLFDAQAEVVHAVAELLVNRNERAAIVNGEMGTGKVRRIGA